MKRKTIIFSATGTALLVAVILICCESDSYSHGYDGIDVSRHQGNINWKSVSMNQECKFVYIKATEGSTYVDPMYKRNLSGARENKIKAGSYHYLRNTSGIRSQFENFKNNAPKEQQDLIPMLDIEEKVHKDSIALFCKLIKQHYGKFPVIYSTNRHYNEFCSPDFNHYILMIGRYGKKQPVIKGKGTYSIWQFTDNGRVLGINKPVDLSRLNLSVKVKDLCL